MAEVILVVLQRTAAAPALLTAAERLAELAGGAHLSVLAAAAESIPQLRAAFARWQARPRPEPLPVRWHEAPGEPEAAIVARGSRADLIVAARPRDDDSPAVQVGFRAALLQSDRPVLVVPPEDVFRDALRTFGRRVAIAWREDVHTTRVVLPALRYVAAAEAVFVLAGMRPGRPIPAMPALLAERRVAAEMHLLPIGPGGLGEDLIDKVHELHADLLVMGAFAHTRLHDLVYGGVTRHVLACADLPVLMRF